MASSAAVASVARPALIYGTAWKEASTAALVHMAIKSGFRAVDTACQPKHYREELVGAGIKQALDEGISKREDIFIQTKFTPFGGQDPDSCPYNPRAKLREQIATSLDTSLRNLHTSYIDSWLLHSPLQTQRSTMEAWRAMEDASHIGTPTAVVRQLGLSNVYDLKVLQHIVENARVRPTFLQNRFVQPHDYCAVIREYCAAEDIVFQSFWTISGNPQLVNSPQFEAGRRRAVDQGLLPATSTSEQFFLKFVMGLGITPLVGTTSEAHMKDDLAMVELPPLPLDITAVLQQYVG